MTAGRPTLYKKEFCRKVEKYLEEREDVEVDVVESDKRGKEVYLTKIRVRLPTIEGFALFLGVHKDTLYEWESKHPEFSDTLEKIRTEQQERLIDNGLSGDYNSTIAKLMLSSNHGMREKSDLTTDDKPIGTADAIIDEISKK